MKPLRIGPPRLLPIVIFASLALLGFKGIGLLTGTGYVLDGTVAAHAAETSGDTAPSVTDAAPRTEPTATDSAPTLADSTPTLVPPPDPAAAKPASAKPAGAAADATDIAMPQTSNATAAAVEAGGAAGAAAATAQTPVCPADASNPANAGKMDEVTRDAAAAVNGTPRANVSSAPAPKPGTNCDAMVYKTNEAGDLVPLIGDDGSPPNATEQTILARLGERRAELDKREADLQIREATVEAAEKQLQDRTDALKALEAKLQALDDQRKAANDAQFAGLVKMYETMKPQEAAPIFDGLDMDVLTRVAKAMDPRKMSAVLAKMSTARAQQLSAALAQPVPSVLAQNSTAAINPNALPQIVGH